MTKNEKTQTEIEIMRAMKYYEDLISERIGDDKFDAWLDRLPLDTDNIHYCTGLKWIADTIRANTTQTHKPSKEQIDLWLNLVFANLKYNPRFGCYPCY